MITIFTNSEKGKTRYRDRLLLSLTDKIDLRESEKNVLLYQMLAFTVRGKP